MEKPLFSILIPAYNGGTVIGEAIDSILAQSYQNFEIIICDDGSKDTTEKVIKSYKDKRIHYFPAAINLGYPGNLNRCLTHAKGEIIYLLGQDDILIKNALEKTYAAFQLSEDIGAVCRPYRWFDKNFHTTVRARFPLNSKKDEIVKITDDPKRVKAVFQVLDSLSALAYRRKYMDLPFHPDIFPCHVYPFASIFKKHPIVFLKDYVSSVRIESSQCRFLSSIYDKSPVLSWVQMFQNVFNEKKYEKIRNYCIKNFVAVNYVGLVQIRNYSHFQNLIREIWYLLKYRWENIFSPVFWFFALGTILTPPQILIPLVDWYKNRVNFARFTNIPVGAKS